MDNSKLITIVVWGTIILVVYEAISSVLSQAATTAAAATPANPASGLGNIAGLLPAASPALTLGQSLFNSTTGPSSLIPASDVSADVGSITGQGATVPYTSDFTDDPAEDATLGSF